MFKGSITALITPFKDGEIDWKAFEEFLEWQVEQGTHAVVPCGTTGESPTLSHDEHAKIVERTVDIIKGRIPVIAGTGSNNYKEAYQQTLDAKEYGADAALVVTPYYNKPSQEGLYAHYSTLAKECDFPIIIYNIPGRSIIDMSNETMARLAKLPQIIGVKDATNDLQRPALMRELIGNDFCLLSGEDGTAAGYLAQGGHGCISVTSNIAPAACAQMHEAWQNGDLDTFKAKRDQLVPIHEALFTECSPQPVKYAASTLGICTDECRLPLLPASENARKAVDAAMLRAGLRSGESAKIVQAHG